MCATSYLLALHPPWIVTFWPASTLVLEAHSALAVGREFPSGAKQQTVDRIARRHSSLGFRRAVEEWLPGAVSLGLTGGGSLRLAFLRDDLRIMYQCHTLFSTYPRAQWY